MQQYDVEIIKQMMNEIHKKYISMCILFYDTLQMVTIYYTKTLRRLYRFTFFIPEKNKTFKKNGGFCFIFQGAYILLIRWVRRFSRLFHESNFQYDPRL